MTGPMHTQTTAVHGGARKDDIFGAINEPIYMTSNYRIPTDGTPVDWNGIHSNIYEILTRWSFRINFAPSPEPKTAQCSPAAWRP